MTIELASPLATRAMHTSKVRHSPHRLRRILVGALLAIAVVIASAVGYGTLSLYRINHAVHHVIVSPALLKQGRNDLLTVVAGPSGHEEINVFRTVNGRMKILDIPQDLSIKLADGKTVALDTLNLRQPTAIVRGLRDIGIPVGRYVGVDLKDVKATSSLGQLAIGKVSISALISDPLRTASLLEAVATHVYLGPHTSVSSLLSLMHASASTNRWVPTTKSASGQVVLAAPAGAVVRAFL